MLSRIRSIIASWNQAPAKPERVVTAESKRLRRARKLLEGGWTQNVFARNKDGLKCGCLDKEATQFCMLGALYAVCQKPEVGHDKGMFSKLFDAVQDTVTERVGDSTRPDLRISQYNDSANRTRKEVLDVFDATIARLETKAAKDSAKDVDSFESF